ncbi:hypothetical protein AGDE_13807 [Angomonas deanei]|nr:hypothetical protein AGDE_13807 [Angomonas deanei]|eukprot:EPY21752.1 hypothetical protein AGDE_13807 [Angomonas deanei]
MWIATLTSPDILERLRRRVMTIVQHVKEGKISAEHMLNSPPLMDNDVLNTVKLQFDTEETEGDSPISVTAILSRSTYTVMRVLRDFGEDILRLFLRWSYMSAEKGLPVIDLGGWRLLCSDLGVFSLDLDLEEPEGALLGLEDVTSIFQDAVASFRGVERQQRHNESAFSPIHSEHERTLSSHSSNASSTIPLAAVNMQMVFPAFLTAMFVLADFLYPEPGAVVVPIEDYRPLRLSPSREPPALMKQRTRNRKSVCRPQRSRRRRRKSRRCTLLERRWSNYCPPM